MIEKYKQYFAQALAKHIPLSEKEILTMIEIPPENIPGDFAFPCFKLAKILQKSPQEIAQDLQTKVESDSFSTFFPMAGYLNANIHQGKYIHDFFTLWSSSSKTTGNVMIEYMSANPNKPLHIGQARNICIGDSMRRIYEYVWYQVTSCNYGDDSGVNVGYNIVGHLYHNIPIHTDKKFDHYCGEVYSNMRALEEDPTFKQQLSEILRKIEENKDTDIMSFHKKYTQDCAHQQMISCWRMWAYFDMVIWETDILHLDLFEEAIRILKDKGYVTYATEGEAAWCRILDVSSLPAYQKEEKQYQILVKSDGVATYIAKDIAFAMRKLWYLDKKFAHTLLWKDPRGISVYTSTTQGTDYYQNNYDEAITVIDYRQIPPQQMVSAALTLLGHNAHDKKYLPLGYGVVYLTPQTLTKLGYTLTSEELQQKRLPFASRKWWTVTIDEMLDMLHTKAYEETKNRNPDKEEVWLQQTAEALAVSALRFFLIRGDITKDIVFDIDEVMDMQGETWAYMLYTGARIQSIIDVAGPIPSQHISYDILQSEEEFALIKKISMFETVVAKAQTELAPHVIAKYCFDIAQGVNSYYAHTKILVDDPLQKGTRVALLWRIKDTLQQAMNLIGMQFVERM